jgi:kinesin family protein 6/9
LFFAPFLQQTGAGKTFTIHGGSRSYEYRGLTARAAANIFSAISHRVDQSTVVRCSYLEIYGEQMFDLLAPIINPHYNPATAPELLVQEDSNGLVNIKNLVKPQVISEEQTLNFLFQGELNRSVARHKLNNSSTRSHCIFSIYLETKNNIEISEKIVHSKLSFVDLAGSERIKKTNSSGTVLREAKNINKSLSALEHVVVNLNHQNREHVPFRQSKLTNLLRDCLGGGHSTRLIANIYTENQYLEETISTLRFATRMAKITNIPKKIVNIDLNLLVNKQEKQIKELQKELQNYDKIINRSPLQYTEFSPQKREEIKAKIMNYVNSNASGQNSSENEIEINSFIECKEIFKQFKVVYLELLYQFNTLHDKISSGTNDITIHNNSNNNGSNPVEEKEAAALPTEALPSGASSSTPAISSKEAKDASKISKIGLNQRKTKERLQHNSNGALNSGKSSQLGPISSEKGEKSAAMTPSSSSKTLGISAPNSPPIQHAKLTLPNINGPISSATAASTAINSPSAANFSTANTFGSNNSDNISPNNNSGAKLGGGREEREESKEAPTGRTVPPEDLAFEEYKAGEGAQLHADYLINKAEEKQRKAQIKQLAAEINAIKQQIDEISGSLARREREFNEEGVEIINETQFHDILSLKSAKQQYESLYNEREKALRELSYVANLVKNGQTALCECFLDWYSEEYGLQVELQRQKQRAVDEQHHLNDFTHPSYKELSRKEWGTASNGREAEDEDFDAAERFDELEAAKVQSEQPESLAYYYAKKHLSTAIRKKKAKAGAQVALSQTKTHFR